MPTQSLEFTKRPRTLTETSLSKSVSSCPWNVPTFDRGITQSYRNVSETHTETSAEVGESEKFGGVKMYLSYVCVAFHGFTEVLVMKTLMYCKQGFTD